MIGPRPCAMSTQFSLVKATQSYKRKHKHKRKLVRFSCAYAYAYVDQVFSCLHMCLTLSLCASKNQADLRVFFQSMDRIKSLFPYKDRLTRAQIPGGYCHIWAI